MLCEFPYYCSKIAVTVGNTLYGVSLMTMMDPIQYKEVWLRGRFDTKPLFGKHEFPSNSAEEIPSLLHLGGHNFCLILQSYTHHEITDKALEYVNCIILDVRED
jgi:hypothetical protein